MKVVVLLSGGLDSTTALAFAKNAGDEVMVALGFRYGSKHNRHENSAAAKVAHHYGVPFWLEDLSATFGYQSTQNRSSLMQTGPPVPEGHYNDENMKQTVVPGRNLVMIAHAACIAESIGAGAVLIGTHAGDHQTYPDCRPEFLFAASHAVWCGSGGKVVLSSVFTKWLKKDVVKQGFDLGVPFHLTRTCYTDSPVACGRCGSCVERREAFQLNGLTDPIEYQPPPPPPAPEPFTERRRGAGGVI